MNIQAKEQEAKTPEQEGVLVKKLLDTRSIIISGEVNQELASKISAQLLILQEMGNEPIKLYLNSQGGHVEAGDTIHDMIRFVTPKVYIIGTGWVASAGVSIYLAVEKSRRLSLPNTRYMIHQPAGGVQGPSVDIAIEAKEIVKIRDRINRLVSKQTGQPLERVAQDTDRNFWMSAKEAVDYGIVGRIIERADELREILDS